MAAECPICFEESPIVRLLGCGHGFCKRCCLDMISKENNGRQTPIQGSKPVDLDLMDTSDFYTPTQSTPTPLSIECPTCRQRTALSVTDRNNLSKAIEMLPGRLSGSMQCNRCDTLKSLVEFRWCHRCCVSICSACFMDEHVEQDSEGRQSVHEASRWIDGEPTKILISYLRAEQGRLKENVEKTAQEYIDAYVEGLKMFITRELNRRQQARSDDLQNIIDSLSCELGIDALTLSAQRAKGLTDSNLERLIENVSHLCKHKDWTELINNCHEKFDINPASYEAIAHLILPPLSTMTPQKTEMSAVADSTTSQSEPNWQNKVPLVIDSLQDPREMMLMDDEKTLIVADGSNGLMILEDSGDVTRVQLLHRYKVMSITPYPKQDKSKEEIDEDEIIAVCVVNGGQVGQHWSMICLKGLVSPMPHVYQVERIEKQKFDHAPLPYSGFVPLKGNERHLLALDPSGTVYYHMGLTLHPHWRNIYSACGAASNSSSAFANLQFGPIISNVDRTTDIYLLNQRAKNIEIVTIDDFTLKVNGSRLVGFNFIEAGLFLMDHKFIVAEYKNEQSQLFEWDFQPAPKLLRSTNDDHIKQFLYCARRRRVLLITSSTVESQKRHKHKTISHKLTYFDC